MPVSFHPNMSCFVPCFLNHFVQCSSGTDLCVARLHLPDALSCKVLLYLLYIKQVLEYFPAILEVKCVA